MSQARSLAAAQKPAPKAARGRGKKAAQQAEQAEADTPASPAADGVPCCIWFDYGEERHWGCRKAQAKAAGTLRALSCPMLGQAVLLIKLCLFCVVGAHLAGLCHCIAQGKDRRMTVTHCA